jgi:hypothetical protein
VPPTAGAAAAGMSVAGGDRGLLVGVVGAPTGASAEGVVDDAGLEPVVDDAVLEPVGLLALRAWCTGGRCVPDAALLAGFGAVTGSLLRPISYPVNL